MGFKRRRNNQYKKKGGARPKLTLIGIICLVVGALLIHYVGVPELRADVNSDNPALLAGILGLMGGTIMILFSLSKRNQGRVVKGMDAAREVLRDDCMCCKCQNCDRNHNHWTHD